jgi:hypothetical protein
MAKPMDPENISDRLARINSLETRRSFLKKAGIGTVGAAALWAAPQMTSVHSRPAYASITGATPPRCVVLFDEDTIDPGMESFAPLTWPSIKKIAFDHDIIPPYLVNETGNPAPYEPATTTGILPPPDGDKNWLEWNRNHTTLPNKVLLPGGQVDDEGVFTLPNATPEFLTKFMNGEVTSSQLNNIDVCALRNNSFRSLIGRDCIGVVYDDDIDVGNSKTVDLRGREISGLFNFTVIGVLRPGIHKHVTSTSSLLSLWMQVLPCDNDFTNLRSAPSIDGDEPPKSPSKHSMYVDGNDIIIKVALSVAAQLNVSIGTTDELENQNEWPVAMSPDGGDVYKATIPNTTAAEVSGKVVLVSSSNGGSLVFEAFS